MLQQDSLVGQNLGDYRILEELGRGGMAVVYKAQHLHLGRYEALKVLHPHLLRDQEIVQRFSQEARAVANLSHTNIATIYNVIQQNGRFIISMEYIEGRSLEQIIAQEGSLSFERTLHILRQISQALDYAHSRHLIHRDVKPANILVRSDGYAVVTDFGIAKAMRGSGMTSNLTQSGIIGTPAYMSPEHIRGEEVDYRTDLYSFGIVCYEMLSGVSPFDNTTTASIVYAQLNTFPSAIRQLKGDLPEYVEAAIQRMLAKRPENRFQSASAFVEALEGKGNYRSVTSPENKTELLPSDYGATIPTDSTISPLPHPVSPQPQWDPHSYDPAQDDKNSKVKWLVIGGGIGLVLLFAVVALGSLLFPGVLDIRFGGNASEISSDNADRIVFASERGGNPGIYLMESDGSEIHRLTESDSSDYYPRWSPDGRRISSHAYPPGIVAGSGDAQLFLIDVETGERELLETDLMSAKFADWSPDGRKLVFSGEDNDDWDLYILNLDKDTIRHLTQGDSNDFFPAWSPDGEEIAFVRILDDGDEREIFITSSDGLSLRNLTDSPGWDSHPSWSSDSQSIAFSSRRFGNEELFIVNANGTGLIQVTNTPGFNNTEPRFSSDGSRLVFVSDRDGNREIYTMSIKGTTEVRLTHNDNMDYNPHW
jgi:serine/threonine protein kinase